jgi:proteasome lid subunit RPN8/RPN11
MRALYALLLFPGLAASQTIIWADRPDDPELRALQEQVRCLTRYYDRILPELRVAAADVLGRLYLEQFEYEYGGSIIERDGEYRVSVPVTNRDRNSVFQGCIAVPKGWRLAAIYHTHAAHPVFSKRDRRNAARLGVPTFMATMSDGRLFRYDQTTRETVEVAGMEQTADAEVRVTWTT